MSTDTQTRGTVSFFEEHLGLGRVISDAGEEIMFHCAEIADGSRKIAVGQRVRYRRQLKFGTWEAFAVESCDETTR